MNVFPKSYRFADVLSIINGRNQKKVEAADGQYPIYGSGGIMGWANDYICPENTVVIGRKGSINNPIYVDRKFWNVDTAFGLVPNRNLLLPRYLFYFCVCFDFEKLNTTVTIPSLTKTNLMQIKMSLPPLGEQEKIICRLDKLCHLIELKKEQLKQLDVLAKSRFIEMFGDPVENPKKWATCPLSTLGTFKNGMNFSSNERGIEIRCLGVGDFKNLSIINTPTKLPIISLAFTPSAEYLLQDGDIIFVRSDGNKALVGRCVAIYTHGLPVTFSGFCIRFRVGSDAVNIMYLLRVLKADTIRKKMAGRGANIQNLNQKMLARLVIPIPPLALQNEFAAFIEQLDKSKFTIRRSLEKLEMLYQALLQEYFG